MEPSSGRRWLIAAVALFLLLLVGWVALALQLTVAQAGLLPFAPRVVSNLVTDYGPDEGARPIALISFSILEDAMQALGLSDEEARAAHESMELAMSQPVPTATAMDFEGAAPYTATPTKTNTPEPSSTPTPLPTSTRPPPTRTPTSTKTSKPTNPPVTAAPTVAATGFADVSSPSIVPSGYSLSPTPGPVGACSVTFTIDDLRVTDAAPSSGIEWVRFKYRIPPYIPSWTYSSDFTLDSGGPSGGGWNGKYDGSLTIDIFKGWCALDNPGPSDFSIELQVKARDFAGKEDTLFLGTYTISHTCDD